MRVEVRQAMTQASFLAAMEIARLAMPLRSEAPIKGLVFDLRESLRAGGCAPECLAADQLPRLVREVPAAMVVPVAVLPGARRYCMECATKGVIVAAFAQMDEAVRWSVQRAGVVLADRRYHQKIQPVGPPHTHVCVACHHQSCPAKAPDRGQEGLG